nr:hypothetical protein [Tanacetum cinerariifolium]
MSNTNNNRQTQTSNTLYNAIMEAGSKDRPPMLAPDKEIPISEGSHITRSERFQETYKNVSQEIRDNLNAEAEAVQIILTGIDNDIYLTIDACPNACEMWKAIERMVNHWNRITQDADDSGPIFDAEPVQKVSPDDHYNVFAMESKHPEQSESVHNTYPIDQDAQNVIIDSLDMSNDRIEIDQNDDDDDDER